MFRVNLRPLRQHPVVFLLVPILLVTALQGCGGGDDSSGTSASAQAANPASGSGSTANNEGGSSGGSENEGGENGEPGSAGGNSVETSSMTKAQFIEQANEICIRESTPSFLLPLNAYIKQHKRAGQSEEELAAEAVREVVLPKFQAQLDQIRNLGAPAGDEAQIEEFLAAMQQGIDSLDQKQKLSLATDVDEAMRHAGDLGRRYGLEACL